MSEPLRIVVLGLAALIAILAIVVGFAGLCLFLPIPWYGKLLLGGVVLFLVIGRIASESA